MKSACFSFLVIAAALWLGSTNLTANASVEQPQASAQSSEESVNNPRKDEVRNKKDQSRSKEVDKQPERPARTGKVVTKHRSHTSYAKPVPYSPRPAYRPATNGPRSGAFGNVAASKQMGSKAVSAVPDKLSSRPGPTSPSSDVSVNGQQFKSSRDPGARLAASGGRLTATRGTAAINGTNMKRKP